MVSDLMLLIAIFENEMQNTEVTLNYFEISPMLIKLIYFFMYSTL